MSLNQLGSIIECYSELKRLHQLNGELLEQLNIACSYFIESNISFPNKDTLYSLFVKANAILNEIQADEPKIIQYNISRRTVTGKHENEGTADKETEPCIE